MSDEVPAAILLYERPFVVDQAAILKAFSHFHAEACGDAKFSDGIFRSKDRLKLLVAGKTVFIDIVRRALPEDLWRPAAEGWSAWKDASQACTQNRFHIFVTVSNDGAGPGAKLNRAHLSCAIAGAVAVAHQDLPLAGLWRDGMTILNPGKIFAKHSCMCFKPTPQIPIGLWTVMLPFTEDETETAIIFTAGLGSFGHLELEFEAPLAHQSTLVEQCRSVISYLVEHEDQKLQNGAQFVIPRLCSYVVGKRASKRFGGVGVYFAALDIWSDDRKDG